MNTAIWLVPTHLRVMAVRIVSLDCMSSFTSRYTSLVKPVNNTIKGLVRLVLVVGEC